MRPKRSAALLLVALALAGCGGDEPAASEDELEVVRSSIVGFGTTQGVRCEDADGARVRGLAVVRCTFEEEEDVSGAMRAQDRCYVVEAGAVVDVTRELPIGTLRTCTLSGS